MMSPRLLVLPLHTLLASCCCSAEERLLVFVSCTYKSESMSFPKQASCIALVAPVLHQFSTRRRNRRAREAQGEKKKLGRRSLEVDCVGGERGRGGVAQDRGV